jgi:hypothetical protein
VMGMVWCHARFAASNHQAARSREQVMLNAPAHAPFAHHLRTQFCRLRAEAVASTVEFSM